MQCRFSGKQKLGFEGACWRTKTLVCEREAKLSAAMASLTSLDARSAMEVFDAAASQWRVGMNGATGLDYGAVYLVANTIGVEIDVPVLRYLQVLEQESLVAMDEEAKKQQAQHSPHAPSRPQYARRTQP